MELFADDTSLGNDNSNWRASFTYTIIGNPRVISVVGTDFGGGFGILGSTTNGLLTNETWKCTVSRMTRIGLPQECLELIQLILHGE